MKKLCLTVLLSLCVLPLLAGQIVTDSLSSHILGATVKYNVFLPEGFDKAKCKHYPVVYLLHGLSDDYTAWKTRGGIQSVADELMRSGEIKDMVIIMPNAGGEDIHNTWNGYFNMPGWSYENFFFKELIPSVEKKYKCGGKKSRRAIMGLSMGGGGSVVYSQRHPDAFSSCYAMSPWLDDKNNEVEGEWTKQDKLYYVCQSVRDHSALDFMDNASEDTIKELNTVKWFIDCGDDDYLFHLSVALHQKMKKAGIRSELRVRDGVHNWEYWHLALRMALPFASRNFE